MLGFQLDIPLGERIPQRSHSKEETQLFRWTESDEPSPFLDIGCEDSFLARTEGDVRKDNDIVPQEFVHIEFRAGQIFDLVLKESLHLEDFGDIR